MVDIHDDKIVNVYEDNFKTEILKISHLVEQGYNYIAFDTEFPGVIYQNDLMFTKEFYYKTIKMNVDDLKLIQVGITLCDENGKTPEEVSTWQFNLKFDINRDKYSVESIHLLYSSGIEFEDLANKGIHYDIFAEYLISSGLVLNDNVRWIAFHGIYDFAYLIKIMTNNFLPEHEKNFMEELELYFPYYFDIRFLVRDIEKFKGSLQKLAGELEVMRIGAQHQAGSDSLLTADIFFKLKSAFTSKISFEEDRNRLFYYILETKYVKQTSTILTHSISPPKNSNSNSNNTSKIQPQQYSYNYPVMYTNNIMSYNGFYNNNPVNNVNVNNNYTNYSNLVIVNNKQVNNGSNVNNEKLKTYVLQPC